MIKYIPHSDINKTKWDECIASSFNGIIYAYSWYLDIVCKNWNALVDGDYETVMPLTSGKKYGIHYLYPPYGTQQLGIFSNSRITEQRIIRFLNSIPEKYKYIEINLNTCNSVLFNYSLFQKKGFTGEDRLTHELPLKTGYEYIYRQYSENIKRNLKKAAKRNLSVVKEVNPSLIIKMFKGNKGKKIDRLNSKNYTVLKKIISECLRRKLAKVWGIVSEKNELCAGAFFVENNNKIVFLFSGAKEIAKENAAIPFLIDRFIQESAGSNKVLDFEGSNNPSLARFYKGFGSKECIYLQIKRNNLPKWIKWIKK